MALVILGIPLTSGRPLRQVLQEARLAPLNTCVLGASQCRLSMLLRVTEWLMGDLRDRCARDMLSSLDCLHELFENIDHELGWYAIHGDAKLTLSNLLTAAQSFEKSEPRDGVFAVLGMLPGLERDIVPDYSRSVASVMQDATRAVLSRQQGLGFLRYVVPHSRDLEREDCSSWMFRADRRLDLDQDPVDLPRGPHAASAGLTGPMLHIRTSDRDSPLLDLGGIVVDEVQLTTMQCSQVYSDGVKLEAWLFGAMEALRPCAAENKIMQSELESELLEGLSDVVVCGVDLSDGIADSGGISVVKRYLQLVLEVGRQSKQRTQKQIGLWNVLESVQVRFSLSRVRNRRLFITKSGRFGLGIEAVRPGDKVVILRGGDCPFILRSAGEQYQFVGAAYVHEIMQGEAVTEYLANGEQEQVFSIR